MSFGEHLDELRARLFKALLGSLAGLVVMLFFQDGLMRLVLAPFRQAMEAVQLSPVLNVFGPVQSFFAYLKVAFLAGLIVAAPLWIYQLWAFIGAGLYERERRAVTRYVPLCVFLFLSGIVFGYEFLIPIGLRYLLTYGDPMMIAPVIGIKEYLGFFFVLTLILGFAFQLPVVMIGLARSGVVSLDAFRRNRRWTILGIFVGAAILTPPDPVTQCLMALPLVLLYELGILAAWLGMGPGRPSLGARLRWPVVRNGLVILLLLFLFREQIYGIWARSSVEQRIYTQADGKADIREMAAELLQEPVLTAYRIHEEGLTALVLVETAQRIAIMEVANRRASTSVTDRGRTEQGERSLTMAIWPAGARLYSVKIPAEVPAASVFPSLLEGMKYGSEELRSVLLRAAREWSEVADGLEGREALEAIKKWFEANGNAKVLQLAVNGENR